jgi:hypothetical protein
MGFSAENAMITAFRKAIAEIEQAFLTLWHDHKLMTQQAKEQEQQAITNTGIG